MELVIVICLLMVILLLISDKIEIRKVIYKKEDLPAATTKSSDIMGSSRSNVSLSVPNEDDKLDNQNPGVKSDRFDQESDTEKNVENEFLQEEPDVNFNAIPDFEQEEEELRRFSMDKQNNGFAQGVTFDELRTVGKLLQEENPEPSQKETAVAIVQKIHGTELFSLLESSMEAASEKIAMLLDGHLSVDNTSGSSTMQTKDVEDFDIGEFV